MKNREIVIRPFAPGDEAGINDLFFNLFGQKRSLADWHWKFVENPAFGDPSRTTAVATKNGRIIAQFVHWPMMMKYGETRIRVAQCVDTMVAPSVGNSVKILKGCFDESFELFKDYARFGFGFPNEIAYKVGKRLLQYRDLSEMIQLFKRLSLKNSFIRRWKTAPRWLAQFVHFISSTYIRQRLPKTEPSIRGIQISEFDTRVDDFSEKFSKRYGIITIRNAKYLNWRYGRGDYLKMIFEKNGEIVGYGVVKIEDSETGKIAFILDYAYLDENGALLSQILLELIRMKVDYALFALMRKDMMRDHLERFGFYEKPKFKPFPVVYMEVQKDFDYQRLRKIENWHLTYGDSDGY